MTDIDILLTEHLDLWTSAIVRKSSAGRGRSKKFSLHGIDKLRLLIFQLAAKGKLVPGADIDSEPLGAHVEIIMGQAPPGGDCNKTGQGTIFVKTGEFGELYPEITEWTTKPLKLARSGDVLICVVGATIGKLNLAIDCAIGRSVAAIRPNSHLETKFLYYSLIPYTLRLRAGSRGSAQGVIGKSELNAVKIRIPKGDEQHRIVAKVEELMALCDRLEAGTYEAIDAHQLLVTELLATLTASRDPGDLADNWARIEAHFDTLFVTEDSVVQLKQTILQLAVMGKLVPRDPKDEPASELLKRCNAKRAYLVGHGKIKKAKPLPAIDSSEIPFSLPEGWVWGRFEQAVAPEFAISYGVLVPGEDQEGGVPFVRIADLSIDDPAESPEKSISPAIDAQYERTRLQGGEILMGVVGSIGKLGVAPESWRGANIARAICRIMPNGEFSDRYLIWLLQSEFMQSGFRGDTRTLAQPTLNINLIRSALTPVPPRAEQERIVAKIEELSRLCSGLNSALSDATSIKRDLGDAFVSKAVVDW